MYRSMLPKPVHSGSSLDKQWWSYATWQIKRLKVLAALIRTGNIQILNRHLLSFHILALFIQLHDVNPYRKCEVESILLPVDDLRGQGAAVLLSCCRLPRSCCPRQLLSTACRPRQLSYTASSQLSAVFWGRSWRQPAGNDTTLKCWNKINISLIK